MLKPREIRSFEIVNAHRPMLGTDYYLIARQIAAWVIGLPDCDLIIDATGVGKGVLDILRSLALHPIAITISAGNETHVKNQFSMSVPKFELVSALHGARDRLHIAPQLPLRDILAEEIAAFQPRKTATGGTTFEAGTGQHDDLVLALSLGVWHQSRDRSMTMIVQHGVGYLEAMRAS
jgi:hypothetical protein